ncbi:MAG: A/G-specific adenine glycosylase [Acidobacteria bacterium]|nr:A/G-specific adenine glycosylase [Acidobacteriota bacterium]
MSRLREFPWRTTRDPWHVLVSEVMLQQTNVGRVYPRFERFIALAPTPAACVAVPLADLLVEWQGMGYPRRCRNIQEAARVIVDRHDGVVPRDLGALMELPGIGPYTARAILAFAFGDDAAVVDTNVARVIARVHGRALKARETQEIADGMLPRGLARDWNQVIMDFGATVCDARTPSCATCPVVLHCAWRGVGVDPAQTTAFTSRPQARFEGSDRQARGRLMKRLTEGSVAVTAVAEVMQLDDVVRAERLAASLVEDGLVELVDGGYRLSSTRR